MLVMKAMLTGNTSPDAYTAKNLSDMQTGCIQSATGFPESTRDEFCTCTIQKITNRLPKKELFDNPEKHTALIESVRAECMSELGL